MPLRPTSPLVALGRGLARDDVLASADAIVVLGGDATRRAPHGAVLYHQGVAPVVVAVGGLAARGPQVEAARTARILRLRGVPDEAVWVLGHDEPNTAGEARATAGLAREHGWSRVIVVSSPYHCFRVGRVFGHALEPLGTELIVSASPFDDFTVDGWWRDRRQRRQVRNEVLRFAWWRMKA